MKKALFSITAGALLTMTASLAMGYSSTNFNILANASNMFSIKMTQKVDGGYSHYHQCFNIPPSSTIEVINQGNIRINLYKQPNCSGNSLELTSKLGGSTSVPAIVYNHNGNKLVPAQNTYYYQDTNGWMTISAASVNNDNPALNIVYYPYVHPQTQ